MLKILWKRGEIAPEEQFLLLSTIFYYLMFDFYVKTGIRFSLRDKRLFEKTEVERTRVDCMSEWLLGDTGSHTCVYRTVQQTVHIQIPEASMLALLYKPQQHFLGVSPILANNADKGSK